MPQFTHKDRLMIEAEGALWAAHTILRDIANMEEHGWTSRLVKLTTDCGALAREFRDYNDSWEEEND